jgi:VWFA-related protein
MRTPAGACSLILAAAWLAPAYAQEPKPQEAPPIEVNVSVVNILCSVHDKKGGLVGNLAKDDFTIAEDGKPQAIKYFTRETDEPLTLGLLIDVSGSQRNLIDVERDAATQFFSKVIRKKDEAFLISFGAEAELLQDYTNSPQLLTAGLRGLHVNSDVGGLHPGPFPTAAHPKGTVLYDAVYLASTEKLRGEVGRKALVLITDGIDEGSSYKLEDAVEVAQKADTIIFAIRYFDPSAYGGGRGFGMQMGLSDAALRKMAEETGGRLFNVDKKHSLQDAFDEIQSEMRSQYAIGYTPTNPAKDGTFRKIEIRTANKDLKVQARKGYFAIKPERL